MEMETKKSNNVYLVIIVLLCIALGIAIGYIAFSNGGTNTNGNANNNNSNLNNNNNNTTNNTNNTSNNNNNNTETKQEVESVITDQSLVKDLKNKTYIIMRAKDYDLKNDVINTSSIYINTPLLEKLTMTDEEKLHIISYSMDGSKVNIAWDKIGNEVLKKTYDKDDWSFIMEDDDMEHVAQISAADMENEYKKLFGVTLINNDTSQCPKSYYDSKNNVYFRIQYCGGINTGSFLGYVNKISQKGNNAYVYLSVGTTIVKENSNGEYEKVILYNSIAKDKVVKEYNISAADNIKIDSSNYNQFSEYKFTFEKDSTGNYYFKSIERTK